MEAHDLLDKVRRNLLISSLLLSIFYLSDATIESINAPGFSIHLKSPEIVIYFLWLTHIYFYYRFWCHCRSNGIWTLSKTVESNFRNTTYFRKIVDVHINVPTRSTPHDFPWMHRKLFKRTLELLPDTGNNSATSKREIQVPYFKVFLHEIASDIKTLYMGTIIVDSVVPYVFGFLPLVSYLARRTGLI